MEPTIAYNPAPPVNPLDQQARVLAIKNATMQGQGLQLENEQKQRELAQTDALNNAYKNALTTDANGVPTFNRDKVFQSVAASGQGAILPKVQQSFMELDKLAGDVQKTKDEHNQAALDYLGSGARMIQQANYDPSVAGTFLAHATAAGYGKEAQQIGQAISQDPSKLKTIVDGMLAESAKQATVGKDIAQTGQAQAATQVSQAELPGKAAQAQQAQRTLAGTSPTGITADQQATLKQGQQRVGLEFQRLQEEKRHNQATEGSLTPEALKMASDQYAATGQMPAVGRTAGMRSQIMNQAALDHPKISIASNAAAYSANKQSLSKLQTNFDQVSAFEGTALRNIDLYLNTVKAIPDLGSRFANIPLRMISGKLIGDDKYAAMQAARQTAATEAAKVLGSATASGVLSDSQKKDATDILDGNLPLKATIAVANTLKQDFANRHQAYADQIKDIQNRIGGGAQPGTQQAPAQHVAGGQAKGLTEGQTGTGSDGKKYVVKGGIWVPQ